MRSESQRYYTPLLACLLLACIVRLWLSLLPESYWLDETVTAFMVRYGINHPSLANAPRLDLSVYYWLPRVSRALLGFSEFSLRLPSLLATLVSLFLIARLVARLINPHAAWFAIFLCFLSREFTRQATDARPYGLGTSIALAAMWFLIRWLDRNHWLDAALFCLFAALLLRVHLIYWPFYGVYLFYVLLRLSRRETSVSPGSVAAVFSIVALSLTQMIGVTLSLTRIAAVHVVVDKAQTTNILRAFQIPLIAGCGACGWLLARFFHWQRRPARATRADTFLLIVWWLWQPVCLLAFSCITGNDIFVPRYFSLAIPGMMLTAASALSFSIPVRAWKPLAAALATGILLASFAHGLAPPSRNSDWRGAASAVNELVGDSNIPVLCPSPFIEAQPPLWTPTYVLPGFFYAHLAVYPVRGNLILLPARLSPSGERYAQEQIEGRIVPSGRFIVYGGIYGVNTWLSWLGNQPELKPWSQRNLAFGDVELVVFERQGR